MFELCDGKLPGGFRGMVSADSCLDVSLQFIKRYADAFSVRLAYALIAANESRERNRFGSRERGVPACSMLHRLNGFAVLVLVFVCHAVLNKLLACLRMLPLAQLGEVFCTHRTDQTVLRG